MPLFRKNSLLKPGPEEEGEERGEYILHTLPEDHSFIYRKCAACGSQDMEPTATYIGKGMTGLSEKGLLYECRACSNEVRICDPGALFLGLIIAVLWGAAAYWAFTSGPLWYLQHPSPVGLQVLRRA